MTRKIIHVDMDCFYAAVEERDRPELKGKPIAVGGTSSRSVLCTANYPARKFGVRSAMSTAVAFKKCPELVVLPPNFNKYREVSQTIRDIFAEYTDLIEPLSLDEAYLDVSTCRRCNGSATLIAQEIRQKIYQQTGLTASAGVSINKFLAKVASDWKKPNGQTVIGPEEVDQFVLELPVAKIPGVGPVTQNKLKSFGIKNCRDLREKGQLWADRHFGKWGKVLYQLSYGIDQRQVDAGYDRKSLSTEETYGRDLQDASECLAHLKPLVEEFLERIKRYRQKRSEDAQNKFITTVTVKMKFLDHQRVTVEKSAPPEFFRKLWEGQMSDEYWDLLYHLTTMAYERGDRPVRLLGVGVKLGKKADAAQQKQLPLFSEEELESIDVA